MNVQEILWPHQREALQWMLSHPRTINGSVMGTGKTIEALALAEAVNSMKTCIVCPNSMVLEWREQIDTWLPHLSHRFDVVNYEKLRKDVPKHLYELLIADECHNAKNPKALQTQGLLKIKSERAIPMSGTPMQNGPQDLWTLFHIIDPNTFNNYWQFVNKYCYVIQIRPGVRMIAPGTRKRYREELRALLHKYMIRHEKDVLGLLPKVYRDIPVQLAFHQRELYDQMEKDLFVNLDNGQKITAPSTIAQVTRLRQLCLEPSLLEEEPINRHSAKTLALLDLVDGTSEPVVIYSVFEHYLRLLLGLFPDAAYYTGTTSVEDRHEAIRRFQQGQTKVFLGSIRTAGTGITLTAAHTAIFADAWWNPAVNEQAEDRLHRIGQDQEVSIIRLWAHNTIEDHLRKILHTKQRGISDIVAIKQALEARRASLYHH